MVNKAHWAPRKSMGLNGFVRGILSSHEPEVHRSPCRTPPQALEFNSFSHVFVSFCCAINIWIPHCLKAQLQRVAVLSKDGNWILKMFLLQPPGTKLLHGNENGRSHHERESRVRAEWSNFSKPASFTWSSDVPPATQKEGSPASLCWCCGLMQESEVW